MPPRLFRAISRVGPHWLLLGVVLVEVALEAARVQRGSSNWLLLSAAVAAVGLGLTWRLQDRLRLVPVALLAVAFHLSVVVVHIWSGEQGDQDTGYFYALYGNELIHGTYPEAEYPVGAVLLFALETLLGDGSAETTNRLLMIPFQLVCVVAVWSLRTPYSKWLATVVAIWPMSIYYWQYRFDLVPAALIVLGLLLAHRQRWAWSGIVLGVGAAVKWTPALSFCLLALWLVAGRRWVALERVVAGFLGSVLLIQLPFLLWQPDRVLSAYTTQGERGITNESVWFFPLWLLGVIGKTEEPFSPAGAPPWADVLAVSVQAAALLGLVALAWRHRERAGLALVLAALAPVVFLLTNRIFSPQFLLVVIAAVAFAGGLAVQDRYTQLALGGLLMAATFANAFVYPLRPELGPRAWQPYSAVVFATIVAAVAIVLWSYLSSESSAADRSASPPAQRDDR